MNVKATPLNLPRLFTSNRNVTSSENIENINSFLLKNKKNKKKFEEFVLHLFKHGNLKDIIYLHQNGHIQIQGPLTQKALEEAISYGHVSIIRYFHQNGASIESIVSTNGLQNAVINDQNEVLKYFHQQGISLTDEVVDALISIVRVCESRKCLDYFYKNGLATCNELHILMSPIRDKLNNTTEHFNENDFDVKESLLYKAVANDCVELLTYFHQGKISFTDELIDKLIDLCGVCGSYKCLEYFYTNGLATCSKPHTLTSPTGDKLKNINNITKHLNTNDFDVKESLLYKAVANDCVEFLKYFHQQKISFADELIDKLIDLCSVCGSCKCLEYFCQNGLWKLDESHAWKPLAKTALQKSNLNIAYCIYKNCIKSRAFIGRYIIDNNISYSESNLPYATLKSTSCVVHEEKIKNKEEFFFFSKKEEAELYYYLATSNGHTDLFDLLRMLFPFLVSDQRIGKEAFELSLTNNRIDILSIFFSNKEHFLKEKQFIKSISRSAILFCSLSTIDKLIAHYYEDLKININSSLMYYAAQHNRLDIILYLNETKGVSPQFFLRLSTENLPEGAVRGFLSDRRCLNELKGDFAIIERMQKEVSNDKKIFHPSHFWEFFNEINITLLKESGFKNFKRNINQNYFNFIPSIFMDSFFNSILFLKLFGRIKRMSKYELIDPDTINDKGDLKEEYRCVFQKHRPLKLWLYKFTVGNLWNYVRARDSEGILQTLEEPKIGNPIEIKTNNKLISQDLANSVQEYYFIKPFIEKIDVPLKIVEVGAGYGRLGYVLSSVLKCKYIIFDIPPALYIAQKYITEIFPNKKIFSFRHIDSFHEIKDELEQSDIAFFTINQIQLFPPDYCNFCINISSLHEMSIDQRKEISRYMSKITKDFIYIKQYKKYKNPFDNIIVKEKDYEFPSSWKRIQRRVTPTNTRFFEMIFQKNHLQ